MIESVYLDNYMCFCGTEIKLGAISLLLGPNGSGKSAAFGAIGRLAALTSQPGARIESAFATSSLTRWDTRSMQTFRLRVRDGTMGDVFSYSLCVDHDVSRRRARIHEERLDTQTGPIFEFQKGDVQLFRDDHTVGPNFPGDWGQSMLTTVPERHDNTRLTRFKQMMGSTLVMALEPRRMVSAARGDTERMLSSGEDFAAWYQWLSQEHQDRVPSYWDNVRQALPGFHSMRLTKVGSEERRLEVGFSAEGAGSATYHAFHELSDGERALIVLYALLYAVPRGRYMILLDEPDNYLGLREIQPWLGHLQDACEGPLLQAALISHHPELINVLGAHNGVWFSREAAGPSRIGYEIEATEGGLPLAEIVARGWER